MRFFCSVLLPLMLLAGQAPAIGVRVHTEIAHLETHSTLAAQWFALDVTAAAADWVKHPESNFGVLLRETGASTHTPGILLFYASEAFKEQADGYGGTARMARRPMLIIFPRSDC